jgi:hypothetical protein
MKIYVRQNQKQPRFDKATPHIPFLSLLYRACTRRGLLSAHALCSPTHHSPTAIASTPTPTATIWWRAAEPPTPHRFLIRSESGRQTPAVSASTGLKPKKPSHFPRGANKSPTPSPAARFSPNASIKTRTRGVDTRVLRGRVVACEPHAQGIAYACSLCEH